MTHISLYFSKVSNFSNSCFDTQAFQYQYRINFKASSFLNPPSTTVVRLANNFNRKQFRLNKK